MRSAATRRGIADEDHTVLQGLGAAVSQEVDDVGGAPVRIIGIQDQFDQSATYEQPPEMPGIAVDGIVAAARGLLAGWRPLRTEDALP